MTEKKKSVTPKKSHVSQGISILLKIATVCVSVWLVTGFVNEFISHRQLQSELSNVQTKLETIKLDQNALADEKANLEDPAYVQNYARGTHLLSKSGETVFIIPKTGE